jgi:hypothetical protein
MYSFVQGLPHQYANLTAVTNLSDNYAEYKINNYSKILIFNNNLGVDIFELHV